MMNLSQIRCFYEVARGRSFTQAAKSLRIGQPAVSRSVRKMEEDLGVALFERRKRSVALTPVGKEIFDSCTRIFQEAEAIDALAASERTECRGPLRFGAAQAISTHLVPRAHRAYLAKHPEVWPMTFSAPASLLLDRITEGELEFGLFFHLPKLPPQLTDSVIAEVPFKLVIATSQLKSQEIRRSFIGSREVDEVGNKSFPTLERLQREDPKTRIRISSNDLTSHKEMALGGLGVAILPEFMVRAELRTRKLSELLPKEKLRFPLRIVTRKGLVLSRAARLYVEEIEAALLGS